MVREMPRILQMTKKKKYKKRQQQQNVMKLWAPRATVCVYLCVCVRGNMSVLFVCACVCVFATNLVKNWSADMPTGKWIKK